MGGPMELCLLYIFVAFHIVAAGDDPPGHLQPLGSHAPGIEVESRDTVPDPIEFFNEYIKPGKPVIMRGVAKEMKMFKLWKDDKYLRENFGEWLLNIEVGKYEGSIFGKFVPLGLRHFLDVYERKPLYIIKNISPKNPMREDISLLKCMACGGYKEHVSEVMLFFSSGSTTSALHRDEYENVHCLLDGTKEWIMYNRNITHLIPPMKGESVYGAVDCRSVDMYKYPIHGELPWYHSFINAGDCFYLPWGWMHNVRSSSTRNMAVAVWFGPINHLTRLDECPEDMAKLPDYTPIPREVLSYSAEARNTFWRIFPPDAKSMSMNEFKDLSPTDGVEKAEVEAMFSLLDLDKDGYFTLDELDNIPEDVAEKIVERNEEPYQTLSNMHEMKQKLANEEL